MIQGLGAPVPRLVLFVQYLDPPNPWADFFWFFAYPPKNLSFNVETWSQDGLRYS
jgi:hypothetical protein